MPLLGRDLNIEPQIFCPYFILANGSFSRCFHDPGKKAAKDTALLHKTKSKLARKLAVPGPSNAVRFRPCELLLPFFRLRKVKMFYLAGDPKSPRGELESTPLVSIRL